MKMKRKGKIHPSPPQPAAPLQHQSSAASDHDSLSVLKFLPAAILAISAVLSLQDREVLAYMITRSLKISTFSSVNNNASDASLSVDESKRIFQKSKNKQLLILHKPPVFDCECFDCYTSFWYRWDSSPNRELIHQAIEAFEEHLASGEAKVKSNRRGKKKEKVIVEKENQIVANPNVETVEVMPLLMIEEEAREVVEVDLKHVEDAATGHKGFARKVLPDVIGVFNSRLWNLWGPNC